MLNSFTTWRQTATFSNNQDGCRWCRPRDRPCLLSSLENTPLWKEELQTPLKAFMSHRDVGLHTSHASPSDWLYFYPVVSRGSFVSGNSIRWHCSLKRNAYTKAPDEFSFLICKLVWLCQAIWNPNTNWNALDSILARWINEILELKSHWSSCHARLIFWNDIDILHNNPYVTLSYHIVQPYLCTNICICFSPSLAPSSWTSSQCSSVGCHAGRQCCNDTAQEQLLLGWIQWRLYHLVTASRQLLPHA